MTEPYPHQNPQPPNPAGPGGQTAIALDLKYHWLAFTMALLKPKVWLNGNELPPMAWGRNVIPVQPGQYQLHVHVPYFLPPRIGPADLTVDVAPGQTVALEYRAPMWNFSRGSLGAPPQQWNGLAFAIGLPIAAVLILVICCCGSILASG